MIDLRPAMKPKSDQLNADDLFSAPMTIRIRDIKDKQTAEQSIWIYFDGDDGKPWKPCKGMLRIVAEQWGYDGSKWIGKSLTIWRDPKATWAGAEVGGIRVTRMSDLKKAEIRTTIRLSRQRVVEYRIKRLDTPKREQSPSRDVEMPHGMPGDPTPPVDAPAETLESVADKINRATVETIESVAAAAKEDTVKWSTDDRNHVRGLLRGRRELLGVD